MNQTQTPGCLSFCFPVEKYKKQTTEQKQEGSSKRVFGFIKSLLPYIARFLPINKRYYLVMALLRSNSTLDRNMVPGIINDALFDCTGNRPKPGVNRKIVMNIFEDLRWVLTKSELEEINSLKYEEKNLTGNLVKKRFLYWSLYKLDELDDFYTDRGLPSTEYRNREPYFFSLVTTRVYISEMEHKYKQQNGWFQLNGPLDRYKYIHTYFYLAYIMHCVGKEAVNDFLNRNWNAFCFNGFLEEKTTPKKICERVLVPHLNYILKTRQTESLSNVSTPFTRTLYLFKTRFSDSVPENSVLTEIDYIAEHYVKKKYLVTPATLIAFDILRSITLWNNSEKFRKLTRLINSTRMNFVTGLGWTHGSENLCLGCFACEEMPVLNTQEHCWI